MTKQKPQPITKEDFDKLLEAMKKERDQYWKPRKKEFTPTGEKLQDYIIALCLGFGAGMRISEIFGLQKKQKYNYTLKDGTVRNEILESNVPGLTKDRIENNFIRIISGKGQKDRVVPLPTKTLRSAGITIAEFKNRLPLPSKRYRRFEDYLGKLGQKVLSKKITPHSLRHGFVSHCFRKGFNVAQIQAWAGHSRMDTTGIYAHSIVDDETAKKLQEVF